jgi:magnesium transporter
LITYYVHRAGATTKVEDLDTGWLAPDSAVTVWADVSEPTVDDARQLQQAFNFHPLSIEDALQTSQLPKVESYGSYLYVVLHGIDFKPHEHAFETQDVDFFVGTNFLVTVHDGRRRSIAQVAELCDRNSFALAEGPVALMHRIVDHMVDHYLPEVDEIQNWLDEIEDRILEKGHGETTADILAVKRDIASLRRVVIPQRDIVGLARREFDIIGQEHAYRFRDVYDHLVRLTDEALMFQDRVTGILDAHLATVSNQLAAVSKVLAGFAVILGPLTVVTGIFGMNVQLPALPGGEAAQFWWIMGAMAAMVGVAYYAFRRKGWL